MNVEIKAKNLVAVVAGGQWYPIEKGSSAVRPVVDGQPLIDFTRAIMEDGRIVLFKDKYVEALIFDKEPDANT